MNTLEEIKRIVKDFSDGLLTPLECIEKIIEIINRSSIDE